MEKNYKQVLNDITTFVFDVDGVLTNGQLNVTLEGDLLRTMNVKDGFALKKAIHEGYEVLIISGGTNEGTRTRLKDLGITNIHLGINDKVECLEEFLDVYDIKPENVAYMGDDIPDIYPMKKVALPTCPQDAVNEVKAASIYVSHKNGGQACVRDLIEQVMKAQNKWHV
ncbi:MAG: KdsC family phosphatase [Psychroflexus halocasei]|uniref:KdsC family phosphatase n=1 Tax=Psychroflexus sp. S27 TaxID=1982757 RepID=UPI000C2987F1|nr:HAD-IIIA family hydrolase [Psychroflexus sp. S27]PJX25191.1 3-deoxy-D-manno-octulosonate 8-phosphate phosphatase [Psychroflexus sp. S27]